MDSTRFDIVTRAWSAGTPRRTLLGLLAGSALGVAGLAESDAKKKKKVILCLNGQTLSVKKSKKGSFLGQGATQGACAVSPPPPPRPSPPPPAARCDDGIKNGDETDVDCGGSCGRCDLGSCKSRDDCLSARCVDNVCVNCQDETQCATDDFGTCVCVMGGCASRATRFLDGSECRDCPERTIACEPFPPGVFCYASCGAGFADQ